jgi:hypothetical protein
MPACRREMAGRIITPYERVLTTTVNDIEHIEASRYPGIGIVKIFFQPGATYPHATAQVTSISQTVLRQMPPGATPPLILNYNASTVPIIQLALSGKGSSNRNVRPRPEPDPPRWSPCPAPPSPIRTAASSARSRSTSIRQALQARGLSAQDVANALAAQNQITRSARQRSAPSSTRQAQQRAVLDRGAQRAAGQGRQRRDHLYARRRPRPRRQSAPQTNIVHVDGALGADDGAEERLGLDARDRRRREGRLMPKIQEGLPDRAQDHPAQRPVGVRAAAVEGRGKEGAIAAALTSADDPAVPRQLALDRDHRDLDPAGGARCHRAVATGETLNIMTLGGLALAVGILVDDATVTIENINWHLEQGKDVDRPRSSTAPRRSSRRPSSRCCASASCSCRCSSCPASPASCSCRWRRR